MRHLALICLLPLVLVGCSGSGSSESTSDLVGVLEAPPPFSAADTTFWWNETVFYEIFVRSFADSDGNGIGDLRGIIGKLDYLNDGNPNSTTDLGVGAIWLMPIFPSPSYHGYDVVDFKSVHPAYGTLEDFRELVYEAHRRGIRVILDLPLNHTSKEHVWFREASKGPSNNLRNFYVWQPTQPRWTSPWGSPVWYSSGPDFYYALFWSGMPDLNYNSPDVVFTMKEVIRFWLQDMDVDGFRLDGVKHLVEEGPIQEHTESTHDLLRRAHIYYKSVKPDAMTVGEIWDAPEKIVPYVGREVDMGLEFTTAEAMLQAALEGRRTPVETAHARIVNVYPQNQYGTFLSNHDQNRTRSVLGDDLNRTRSAATLLLTGPGVPFVYYGEEVGQGGTKPDENLRTPMQWSGERFAGFTRGFAPWAPAQADHHSYNVALMNSDPGSLLNHYRKLIHLRNRYNALHGGDWTPVACTDDRVYSFLRRDNGQNVLVVVNLSDERISKYSLTLEKGPLGPGLKARELYLEAPVYDPEITAEGGFTAYRPMAALPPTHR